MKNNTGKDLGIIKANDDEIKKIRDEIKNYEIRVSGNEYLIDYLKNINESFKRRIDFLNSEIEILSEQ